jgi:TolB-like protein
MLVVGLGFVAALVIAWAYELTPDGIKKESVVDRSQSIVANTGKKLDRIIIGFMALAIAVLLIDRSMDDGVEKGPGTISTGSQVETSTADTVNLSPETVSEPATAADNSIAVLPFANRSLQPEDLFFTDGIHDDLLTQLAKISDLKVISRTSMMKYRDTEKSIPEIATELSVSTILEGGIQRAGKRIRINAQLIDVSNDQHLWAETFDREMTMENIFDIQSEITRQIVTAVKGELTEADSANLSQLPTGNLEAYEAYLQALTMTNRADYVQDNYINAEHWLQKAIGLDPSYVQAWALLTEVHGQAAWMGYDSSPERMQAAKDAVGNAVKFGPGLSETLAAEGEYLYRISNDYQASVEKFQAAAYKAPGDTDILEKLGVAQRRAGLFDEAIASFSRALQLDPGNSRSATLLANTLLFNNRFEQAAPLIDQWMLRFPDARDLRAYRISSYYRGWGDLKSARELLNSMTPWGGAEYVQVATTVPLLERDYQAVIDAFEMPEISALTHNRGWVGFDGWLKGFAYRALGNAEAAQAEFKAAIDHFNQLAPTGTQVDGFEQGYLSLLYAGTGMFDEAVAAANRAVEIMESSGDAIFGSFGRQARRVVSRNRTPAANPHRFLTLGALPGSAVGLLPRRRAVQRVGQATEP